MTTVSYTHLVKEGIIVLRGEKQGKDIIFTLIDNGTGLQGKQIDLTKEYDLKPVSYTHLPRKKSLQE